MRNNNSKYISIFGSYKPTPSDEEYQVAYKTAFALAKKGYIIKNGGGNGIMEASTFGARDAGGESIGYILKELYKVAPSLQENINNEVVECSSLFDRLKLLIEGSSAFILFSGGTGTLAELALTWELMNKKLIKELPIICYKKQWKPIIDIFKKHSSFVKEGSVELIKFANSIEEIVSLIK